MLNDLILDPEIDTNKEFLEYKEELESFPWYTPLTPEERIEYERMDALPPCTLTKARAHPFLWAKWVIGIKPRDYQWKLLDMMKRSKRLGACTARQVGKSFTIAVFSFWAAYTNVAPRAIDKKTKIGIVSRTEDQAKKLLTDIMTIIGRADATFNKLSRRNKITGYNNYFTSNFATKPNRTKIEWAGGIIEVYPPTDSILGESLCFLIIDEADKLKTPDGLEYFWDSSAMPTVKETEGSVFAFSTPKGVPTPFYWVINPDQGFPGKGWNRIWYPWTINKSNWAYGWAEREKYITKGKRIFFATEYEASFQSGAANFFDLDSVKQCTASRGPLMEWNGTVTVGLDYGSKVSRTVATFWGKDKENKTMKLLWYKEFPESYDNSKLPAFFNNLRDRYRLKVIYAEDCPAGDTPTNMLRQAGFNVKLFMSKADKIRTYENVRIAINNFRVEFYEDTELMIQLKTIEEVESQTGYQIKKARGMRDDIVDACIFGLSEFTKPRRISGKRRVL